MVEVFPVFNGATLDFVTGQVGDGADVPGGDFGHNHRAPCGFVSTQLLFEGVGGHVLQVQIQRGYNIQTFHRVHEVVVRHGHPLVAGHTARQLLSFHTRELVVPGALNPDALVLAVDAYGAGGELAKGTATVFTTLKHQAALVASELDEGQIAKLLVGGEGNVSANQRAAVSAVAGVVEFGLEARRALANGGAEGDAQRVDLGIVHVPTHAFALGVPTQVIDGDACGEKAAVAGHDLAAGGFDGAHARGEFFPPAGPRFVLHGLDHEDAPKHHQANDGQAHKHEPNASCVGGSVHSSADKRMGGSVGCSRPSSAVERARRLC